MLRLGYGERFDVQASEEENPHDKNLGLERHMEGLHHPDW